MPAEEVGTTPVLIGERVGLLVGCPVLRRDWVLPWWFRYVEQAMSRADIDDFGYVFVVDPSDRATMTVIADTDRPCTLVEFSQAPRDDRREWNPARYEVMVELRNTLLREVRRQSPWAFLSLDSDILLNQRALVPAIEQLQHADAVGMKLFMVPRGKQCPSYANLTPGRGLDRPDCDFLMPSVDVIMAAKLMSPSAYMVDYRLHKQGEDVGWSIAARERFLTLAWDGRTCSKHVMNLEMLNVVDERCGY